jgi:SAM-dependent methyltransferase
MGVQRLARRYAPRSVRRLLTAARFGDLRRTQPLTPWGYERGTPVDRWYIERYLLDHAELVRGNALEVKSDAYAHRFGADTVDVVDIDVSNPHANVYGDLCAPGTLQTGIYDVAVVTQTLQLLAEPLEAVRHLVHALRPGGSLLVTVPTLSRLVDESDRWRWTPSGLRDLLIAADPGDSRVETVGLGNGLAARAFLFGLAVEDLDADVLARSDDPYPMVVGGLLQRSA